MSRSKRMRSVAELAEAEEQTASRRLGESLEFLKAQEAKLEELEGYRKSYTQNLSDAGGRGTDAIRLGDYRAFLDRLGAAITQQTDLVKQAQDDCETKRQMWFAARRRLQALSEVVKRYASEENLKAERREQAEADDVHASRQRRK